MRGIYSFLRLNPVIRTVFWNFRRLWENVGCKPCLTKLAVERRSLENTVIFFFKTGFRQISA